MELDVIHGGSLMGPVPAAGVVGTELLYGLLVGSLASMMLAAASSALYLAGRQATAAVGALSMIPMAGGVR